MNKERDIPLFVEEDENEVELNEEEHYDEINLNRFNREEGYIYESIADELSSEEVIRQLPDFEVDFEE